MSPRNVGDYKAAMRRDPCVYCGARAECLDHIDPKARGGANTWANLAPSCCDCNGSKNDATLLSFLGKRAVLHVIRPLRLELAAWNAIGRPA